MAGFAGSIPAVLRAPFSWPSVLTLLSYPHGFAVNFFVAEFADTAVVSPKCHALVISPRYCGQLLRRRRLHQQVSCPRFGDQFLRDRVFGHRGGISTGFEFSFFTAACADRAVAIYPCIASSPLLRGRSFILPLLLVVVAVVYVAVWDWHLRPLGWR